jgi:hypothetical protein
MPGAAPIVAPALPPAILDEGARMFDAAALALRTGDLEGARRYQGAAYMLTRAPRVVRTPAGQRDAEQAYTRTIVNRILAALKDRPATSQADLFARMVGKKQVISSVLRELVADGAVVTFKGERRATGYKLAPVASGELQ